MNARTLLFLFSVSLVTGACETYDAPPEVSLIQPKIGFWLDDTPIELTFTEPIDPASLVISVWPNDKDLEGAFRPGVVPLIKDCTPASSPCGALTLTLDATRTKATLEQNGAFVDRLGKPLVLEVQAGLKDERGRVRKVADLFDFQVNVRCGNLPVDIPFDTGLLTLTANLQVLPVWLHMVFDVAVDPTNGKVLIFATFSRLSADANGQQRPPNTNHPEAFAVAMDANGWAVTFTGCFADQEDGTYFLQSDPFDVHLTVLGAVPVVLAGFQVQGTLVPGGAPDGRDFISGTLSTSGGNFGDPPTDVAAITTAWDGFSMRAGEYPSDLPQVCAEKPCAGLEAVGGDCQLPASWDPAAYCPEAE